MLKRGTCLCLIAALLIGLFVTMPLPAQAASDMVTSEECIAMIKEFEGFSGSAYLDTDGLYTIGYGTRCPTDMVEYYKQYPMTEEEADAELRRCVVEYEASVNKFQDKHGVSFTQGQFDGVISMVYNCGAGWLNKGTTLINALSTGATGNDLIQAFTIYSLSGGVRSVGHVTRRLAEANMYLNGVYQRKVPDNFAYVLYMPNGGKVSGYDVQGYDVNLTATPLPTATYSGYTFLGWYTAATGGRKVTVLDASTRNCKLYAHWKVAGESDTLEDPSEGGSTGSDSNAISVPVQVTGTYVNVRSGPGLSYDIVGKAVMGDRLTITETVECDNYLWGHCELGWLALTYTDYKEQKPTTVTKTYGTVIGTSYLNVRSAPDGQVIGELHLGDRVEILEQGVYNDRLWGRYEGGWICMRTYISLEAVTETVNAASVSGTQEAANAMVRYGTVVNTRTQNVRSAPYGTIVDKLNEGDRIRIYEIQMVDGCAWGQSDAGWVCLRTYVRMEGQDGEMIVSASCLNVRSAAGTDNAVVAQLACGTAVTVLETAVVEGRSWARISGGWVCMEYLV